MGLIHSVLLSLSPNEQILMGGLVTPRWLLQSRKQSASIPVVKKGVRANVLEAGNPREYILERHMIDGTIRRELNCPRHQMLGYGTNIQGTAEDEHAEGTILLLQIDSDEDRVHEEFMFGAECG